MQKQESFTLFEDEQSVKEDVQSLVVKEPNEFLKSNVDVFTMDVLKHYFPVRYESAVSLIQHKIYGSILANLFIRRAKTQELAGNGTPDYSIDYILMGVAWDNDETNIRHLNAAKWNSLTADSSYSDLYANSEQNSVDISGAEIMAALSDLLSHRGILPDFEEHIKEVSKKDANNYNFSIPSTDSFWWNVLHLVNVDWKRVKPNSENTSPQPTLKDWEDVPAVEDGMYLVYFDTDYVLKSKWLTNLHVTEPRLVDDSGNNITWNY